MAITASPSGGTRNWSDTATWVGGIVPTASSDVLLTVTSGAVIIDGVFGSPSLCRSLNCTGYTNTLTHSGAYLQVGDGTTGNFLLVAGMTYATDASSQLIFASTTTGNTITTAAKDMPPVFFNGSGGAWTFQDNFDNSNDSGEISHTAGTLNFNGKTVTTWGISSTGSNTRSLTLGTATINVDVSGNVWTVSGSGLTFSGASATWNFSGPTPDFIGGGQTYGTVSMSAVGGGAQIDGGNTFSTLTITGDIGVGNRLLISGTNTISGTLTINGNSSINRLLLTSAVVGTAATLSAGTWSSSYLDLMDITHSGGTKNISGDTGGSGDCGGNSGFTFTTPITCFLKTAVSCNYSDSSKWFTTSGGSIPARTPLPQDTVRIDSNSVTAGSVTLTFDMQSVGSLNSSGVTHSPTFNINGASYTFFFGDFIIGSGVTYSASNDGIQLYGRGSQSITTNGVVLSADIFIISAGGTYTITDVFTHSSIFQGFLIMGGTLTVNNVAMNIGMIGMVAGQSGTDGFAMLPVTINMGSGTWTLSGTGNVWWNIGVPSATINASTSTIVISDTSSTTKIFSGQGGIYHNLTINGAASCGTVTVTDNNTFSTLTLQPDSNTVFTNGQTNTAATLSISGTSGHLVIIASDSSGLASTLSCSSAVNCDYISVKDNTAAGNTPFYAGTHSTNVSGNTNWTFTARPVIVPYRPWMTD